MASEQFKAGGFAGFVVAADALWRRVARWMIVAGGWATMLIGAIVAVDVLGRNVFGRNLGGADEIGSYLFAIGISWSLAEAFYARSHVRIDFLYNQFGVPIRALLDVLALLAFIFLAAFLIFSGWLVVSGSWTMASRSATSLQVPLIIPQALWLVGFVVFLVALVLSGIKAMLEIGQGAFERVTSQLGVMSPTEEAEDAVKSNYGRT